MGEGLKTKALISSADGRAVPDRHCHFLGAAAKPGAHTARGPLAELGGVGQLAASSQSQKLGDDSV